MLDAAYVGFSDGNFYELVNLNNGANIRREMMALPQDRWVVVTVGQENGHRVRTLSYYDKAFELRARRTEPTLYDPGTRPWFQHATTGAVYKTAPYLFQIMQVPGQTYSIRIPHSQAVLAVDMPLSALSVRLKEHRQDPRSQIYLYQSSGELIASTDWSPSSLKLPTVSPLQLSPAQRQLVAQTPSLAVSSLQDWPPFDFTVAGEPNGFSVEMLSLIANMTGLKFNLVNGQTWPEFVRMFKSGQLDILASVICGGSNAALGRETQPYVQAPYGVLTPSGSPPISRIEQLFGKRVAIPAGWSILDFVRKHFPQVHIVPTQGVQGMFSAVRHGRVDAGLDTAAELQYTVREFFYRDVKVDEPLSFGSTKAPTGLCYVVQPKHAAVVPIINEALEHVTSAQREVLANRWLLAQPSIRHLSSTVPYPQLIALASDVQKQNSLQTIKLKGRKYFVFVAPVGKVGASSAFFSIVTPVADVLAPAYAEVRKAMWFTLGIWLFLLPLAYWLATLIVTPVRLLAIEEEKIRDKKYDELVPVSSNISEIDDLAASQNAMAHAIQKHAKEQEALMDSFIQLIAQAIDEKSPYTGGHCARVPELAMLLAHRAHESNASPFRDFAFKNDAEWREFRIGAWLHDCGKVTTPEHVVDKGSKLETIYNRIHEIRTRFEVLWRDAEIHYLRQSQQDPQAAASLMQELEEKRAELQEQFAFIACCNQGGESMDEVDIVRLKQLSKITWQRHFDDTLGLSPAESARIEQFDSENNLPATEYLLADKPWHKFKRTRHKTYPERFGIHMDIPDLLYDRGELYNLTTRRGTLTAEDRFTINEHIISTIVMLDTLPLPQELQRVPRYASTHHETLDGRGYPRKLTAKDLSIPERIMVLADIFEALTASDRPYKKAKTLSVALDIMYRMVEDLHIDRDVFELFLRSGAYLEYARAYLPDSQIDEVEIEKYLA